MIKKKLLTGIILLTSALCRAQSSPAPDPVLPKILPETPTAAGLIKAGMGEVNKSTGAATASLPLYTLKCGNYTLPISLSYFSQGNKVEEVCSRVGFGWSLACGGVVSRRVMGMPDEKATRYPIPADISAETQANIDYFDVARTGGVMNDSYDTQPDEFNFSFNGHNGKFLINDNGVPEIITHENLKIVVLNNGSDITSIQITTADGIKYFFGGGNAYEKVNHTGTGAGIFPRTAFYLNQILLSSGQTIDFTYTKFQTNSNQGFSQSIILPQGSCDHSFLDESIHYSFQNTTTDACALTSVATSEGTIASFHYQPLTDGSNDKRLKDLIVQNQQNRQVAAYDLTYEDLAGWINDYPVNPYYTSGGRNGRFFLKKIQQRFFDNNNISNTLDYDLDYYDQATQVNVLSQDHYGFFNGKPNQNLIPKHSALTTYHPSTQWADRSSDWTASVKGMLHNITYPTKGKEEFIYEANTVSSMEEVTDMQMYNVLMHSTPGTGYYTDYLTVHKNQTINISFFPQVNGSSGCNFPCDICKTADCKITDLTTGLQIQNFYIFGSNGYNAQLQLIGGHTYKIESRVWPVTQACINVYLQFVYDAAQPGLQPVEKEVGGVRVKQIKKTDGFGNALNKYFFYGTHDTPAQSSGVLIGTENYLNHMRKWVCDPTDLNSNAPCYECDYMQYTSNGVGVASDAEKSFIVYKNIIEADDPLFTNGATEYTFYQPSSDNTNQIIIRNDEIPFPPAGLHPNLTGKVQLTKVFNGDGLLKNKEENTYEVVNTDPVIRSIYIRKAYEIFTTRVWIPQTVSLYIRRFDVRETRYTPGWVRLHDTKTTSYDNAGNPFETNTNYIYGTAANTQPAAISTTDSKGATVQSLKKYPTDFPSDPVLAAMTAANMIAPVIEGTEKRGSTEIGKTNIIYQNNGAPGGGFQPYKIQQKQLETNATEERILFSAYDDKGNLKEVSKAQDGKISYLWDYNKSLVAAEVKNAPYTCIAYTSFEADSKGNFTYAGTASANTTAPTGKMVYDLATGAITVPSAATISKPYIISYWSNTAAKSVTGSSSFTTGRSAGGWTYYEHTVSSLAAGTTISGSGLIDELRMYPSDALMTTYTYEPLVGVTSQSDVNNRISYYEYDGLNRLVLIRDQNKNIAKKICYNYAGMPEDCGITTAVLVNQAASGSFTRNDCPPGYIGSAVTYTVPAGTYSAYTQSAADLLATNDVAANGQAYANAHGTCTASLPCGGTCNGINKKCINNVCETGTLVYLTSVKVKNQNLWNCSYMYCFSDQTSSAVQTMQNTLPCLVDVCQ
jgi:hypothetical protein